MLNIVTTEVSSGTTSTKKKKCSKNLKNMLIDSLTIAGLTMFSSLVTGGVTVETATASLMTAGLAFFTQLAYYRGLKKNE